jgi:amidase
MQRLMREHVHYHVRADLPPALQVKLGESFLVETQDFISGRIRTEGDLLTPESTRPFSDYYPPKWNPVTGPVHVDGVARGDVLVVEFEQVIPNSQGVCCIVPGVGPLADSGRWPELNDPATILIENLPGPSGTTRDGTARWKNHEWPLNPFIGTIGVAPDHQVESSLAGQGVWGGNWDCRDMKEKTRLMLPVFHDGGMLFMGDMHASQGDTEWCGVANEVQGEVILKCEVQKNKRIPYPRLEKPESIVQLFVDRPLEDAVKKATIHLMEWLVDEYGFTSRDAYFLLSVASDFRINIYQMVKADRFDFTVGAELPKHYLN